MQHSIRLSTIFQLSLLLIITASCATYKPDYSLDARDWRERFLLPDEEPEYTMFLVGDVGLPNSTTGKLTLSMLDTMLKKEPAERSGVIFLGDNVYPKGIPESDAPNYDNEVAKLYGQYQPIKDFKGDIVFIPGNHDWGYGRDALKRQDDLIEAWLGQKKILLPDWGCGGPEDKDLTDNVVMLAIDSQWYMENWDDYEDFNEDCDVQSRSEFLLLLKDELGKLKDKTVLLAVHHPVRSYGPHGGQYSFKNEFFPFLELSDIAWIPMPGLAGLLRRNLGISQDLTNPGYERLIDDVMEATRGLDNVIFVSGHEHTLQYIEDEEHPYIVSGAGSKRSPANAGGYAKYTSGQGGLVQLDIYEDGRSFARFYNGLTGNLDYATEVLGVDSFPQYEYEFYQTQQDSILTSIYDAEDYPNEVTRALWGNLNREMYYDSIKLPVFYFEDYPHKLEPNRRGGGNQTNSLHLINAKGQEYQLRSVKKDGSRILGGVFAGTFVVDILEDVFTYGHPYGALVLDELADSAKVYHTNPKLVYLPRQPRLGIFNQDFGGEVYLFEERPDEDGSHVPTFGSSSQIVGTDDMMEEVLEDYTHHLDTNWMIRSRLFDFMIGDWDRHQDNWRWSTFRGDTVDGVLYRAVPRDRDMVFTDFSGFMISILNRTTPQLRQFQTYGKDIPRMKWYGEYPKFYDRRFIAPTPWPQWKQAVEYIQNNVSDSLIQRAISSMPASGYAYSGDDLVEIMQHRKKTLMEISREYYELLAENVDLLGTNDDDSVHVYRKNEDETLIEIYAINEDDGSAHLRIRRTFYTDETDEVRIYTLDSDDVFYVHGSAKDGITVRLIGGYGEDKVIDSSYVRGFGDKTEVYDYPGGNIYETGDEADLNITKRYDLNNYEFKDFHRNYSLFLPNLAYNPDFGFSAGLGWHYFNYGYKKQPEAYRHKLGFQYAFGNQSFTGFYEGVFSNVFGYWGIAVDALFHGPRFTLNYFGPGNDSEKDPDLDREYYQVRQRKIALGLGLRRAFKYDAGYFEIKPFYNNLEVEATEDRFITEQVDPLLRGDEIFENMNLAGLELNLFYDTRNNNSIPTKGLLADFGVRYSDNLGGDEDILSMKGELTFYQRLAQTDFLVWATKFGAERVVGDYMFFQSAYVGGPSSLRGYRMGRFRGQTSFYNMNDFRFNFGEVKNRLLPFDFGLIGAFDHGRVWHEELESNSYHYTYGGGIFINALDMASATLGYHIGDEEGQWLFSLGFNF